jgi:hypothetical protein
VEKKKGGWKPPTLHIPAKFRMTVFSGVGIFKRTKNYWIPACAGMTIWEAVMTKMDSRE